MGILIFIIVIVIIIFIISSKSSKSEKVKPYKVNTNFNFSRIEEKLKEIQKKNDEWSQLYNPISELNNEGINLEKENKISDAIKIYEKNISYIESNYELLNHIALHPFERLMILYHKLKRIDDEKHIIQKGLSMKDKIDSRTIDKWKIRLEKLTNPKVKKITSVDRSKIVIPNHKTSTLGHQLDNIENSFPQFNFYENGKDFSISWEYSQKLQKHKNFDEYHRIRKIFLDNEEQGLLFESQNKFIEAINLYVEMVSENSLRPKTYDRLIILYRKFKLIKDEIRILNIAIRFFTNRRDKMKENLLNIADTDSKLNLAEEYINNQKRFQYYNGMFDLYNPYAIINKWEKRLEKINDKST